MRKCAKCTTTCDEPLNFCPACGAMLETVVEESVQPAEIAQTCERPAPVSHTVLTKLPQPESASKSAPAHFLKDVAIAAIEEAMGIDLSGPSDSELTLLNLHGRSTVRGKPGGQCPSCGSTKILSDIPVRCKNADAEMDLSISLDGIQENALLADVCSECGHAELKVKKAVVSRQ